MDKVHAYIEEEREFYRHKTRRDLLEHIATVSGTFWIEDELEPWERMVRLPTDIKIVIIGLRIRVNNN